MRELPCFLAIFSNQREHQVCIFSPVLYQLSYLSEVWTLKEATGDAESRGRNPIQMETL